jgi:pimeloyl-ACP methyl ester carboxylesterase
VPKIQAPTMVIHGNADPLVPVACGHQLAREIPGARSDFIDGMGHDLPLPLLARLADDIVVVAGASAAA